MKLTWLTALTVPVALVPALWSTARAQGTQMDAVHGRLARVQSGDPDDDADSKGQSFDAEAWRKRLKQSDLDARQRDFDALVKRARREKNVREAIDRWAHDSSDGDLAWTSRLLQREVDAQRKRSSARANDLSSGRANDLSGNGDGTPDWDNFQNRFNELQKQFGGMDSQFGRLQNELDRMMREQPQFHWTTPGSGGSSSTAKSFTLQVGPDGVTCRVRENVDGKEQTKEYKAESMEALLDAHPELRDQIGVSGNGFGWNGPLFHGGQGFTWGDGNSRDNLNRLGRPFTGAPTTDILGVEFSKLAPEESKALNLEPERGLHVERVLPGTIAQILGIRRGDLLIEMNGVPLYGGDDVSKVLRERTPDAEVVVVLIDGKGQRRTLTWKPANDAGQSAAPPSDSKREPSKKF
jgi:hypothetical protein